MTYIFFVYFRMYTSGINPKINGIYPTVEFPVSRGTPALPSLPLWDHNDQWTPTVARDAFVSLVILKYTSMFSEQKWLIFS